MRVLLTILVVSLTCESVANILGILGFLVFASAALFLSCLAENKRKAGFRCHQYTSNIYVNN